MRQMAILEDEFQGLPGLKIDDIQIKNELFAILKFILEQNQHNVMVSFSQIGQQFSIVRPTVRKRLRLLEDNGLVIIRKHGRTKSLHVSEKGMALLNKRKAV
jgi:DNA-binding MarR family transcriptional regulator